jgi:microcystin-dependent protein
MMNGKRALVAAILLAWIPTVMTVAYPQMYKWSQTASSNATSDPSINWRESQAPSSVNDSARAMMASIAAYRDDISGSLTTSGTSTAYTLSTNEGLQATPVDGQLIAFTPHVTNGTNPTLTVDGGTTYNLAQNGGFIPPGYLIVGTPYTAKFSLVNAAWIFRDAYNNSSPNVVPLGGLIPFLGNSSPSSNFIIPQGQCISRTTYAVYFAMVSTTFGTCDGSTTFGVPNMGGFFFAQGGSALSAACGSGLGTVCGAATQTLISSNLPAYTPSGSVSVTNGAITINGQSSIIVGGTGSGGVGSGGTFGLAGSNQLSASQAASSAAFTGSAQGGTSAPFTIVPPTVIGNYLLRII